MSDACNDRTDPGELPLDGLIEKGLRFGFSKETASSASDAEYVTRASQVRLRDPLREVGEGSDSDVGDDGAGAAGAAERGETARPLGARFSRAGIAV